LHLGGQLCGKDNFNSTKLEVRGSRLEVQKSKYENKKRWVTKFLEIKALAQWL
jgi:hypothetical protein